MKALSVVQPWAWAIVHAGKNIENRSWRTHYRGILVIHASLTRSREGDMPRGAPKVPADLDFGAILGTVELVDCVERSRSKWFQGPYGWVLENPRPLRLPIPCRGNRSLWDLSPAQRRLLRTRLRR